MKNWLEKQFRLSEFNTNIKTELLAGLTTFVTMAYVLATIPNILAGAGYDKHTTLTAMIILDHCDQLCNGIGYQSTVCSGSGTWKRWNYCVYDYQ